MQIRSRSGLALNNYIAVLNAPGTIDSDYRGEVKVILINHGDLPFTVTVGMRIAQAVISKVEQLPFEYGEVNITDRSDKGFGST